MGRGCILGFSSDEREVYYLEGFIDRGVNHQKETPITFVACDARTGHELRRMQFVCESDFAISNISCPDHFETVLFYGSRARIQESKTIKPVAGKPNMECVCYLYDLKTGKRLGGPWDCASDQDVRLSPDGKWIYSPGSFEPDSERRVFSSSSGEVIYRSQSKTYQGTSCFSKDSRSLATLEVRQGQDHVIMVDMASGKETHAFELPDLSKEPLDKNGQPPHWRHIVEWDGRRLRLSTISTGKNNQYEQLTYRFEVGESGLKPLGKEPEYRLTRMDGQSYVGFQRGDAIMYLFPGLAAWPDWFTAGVGWVDKSLRTKWVESQKNKYAFAFYDLATQHQRCVISIEKNISTRMSETGHSMAVLQNVQWPICSIQVWNTDPPGRWLMAGGLGLAVGALVFGFLRLLKPGAQWDYVAITRRRPAS